MLAAPSRLDRQLRLRAAFCTRSVVAAAGGWNSQTRDSSASLELLYIRRAPAPQSRRRKGAFDQGRFSRPWQPPRQPRNRTGLARNVRNSPVNAGRRQKTIRLTMAQPCALSSARRRRIDGETVPPAGVFAFSARQRHLPVEALEPWTTADLLGQNDHAMRSRYRLARPRRRADHGALSPSPRAPTCERRGHGEANGCRGCSRRRLLPTIPSDLCCAGGLSTNPRRR